VEGRTGSRAPGCCPSPSSCVFEIDAANQPVLADLYCCATHTMSRSCSAVLQQQNTKTVSCAGMDRARHNRLLCAGPENTIDFCDGACSPTPCCNGKPCVAGPGVDPQSIFCVTDLDTGIGACCVDAYQNCGGECCAGECVAGAPGRNKTCVLPPAAPGG